jgi:hypothetical protein
MLINFRAAAIVVIGTCLLAGCGAGRQDTATQLPDVGARQGAQRADPTLRYDDSRLRAALLPAPELPELSGRRTESDLQTAFGKAASATAGSTTEPPSCANVVQGSNNLGTDPSTVHGWGFQLVGANGYLAEAVGQSSTSIDLATPADALRRCAHATVSQHGIVATSTIELLPDVAVPAPAVLAYEQSIALPGQLPMLRVRTVVMARDDVVVLLASSGPGLDATALATKAWQHASDELE